MESVVATADIPPRKGLSTEELVLSNCGVDKDS